MPVRKEKVATRPARKKEAEVAEVPADARNEKLEESTKETLDEIACCLAEFDEIIEATEEERVRAKYITAASFRGSDQEEYEYRMKLLAEQYPQLVVFVCGCGGVCNFGWYGS